MRDIAEGGLGVLGTTLGVLASWQENIIFGLQALALLGGFAVSCITAWSIRRRHRQEREDRERGDWRRW